MKTGLITLQSTTAVPTTVSYDRATWRNQTVLSISKGVLKGFKRFWGRDHRTATKCPNKYQIIPGIQKGFPMLLEHFSIGYLTYGLFGETCTVSNSVPNYTLSATPISYANGT